MVIFGGVDGTGILNLTKYAQTCENSFTRRIYKNWGRGRIYERGPEYSGVLTGPLAAILAAAVASKYPFSKGVILGGHSRGAAAAIHASYLLEQMGINVDYLFLFDAVNMYISVWTHVIPSNVAFVYHARRDPQTGSRPEWGNCGCSTSSSQTKYFERFFFATHSGLGGVPWQTYYRKVEGIEKPAGELIVEDGIKGGRLGSGEVQTVVSMAQDEQGSDQVAGWMLPIVREARELLEKNGKPSLIVPGTPPPRIAPGTPEATYTVVQGDSLSLITEKLWGDILLWPILYKKNSAEIGPNHNLIHPGQTLAIPNLQSYSRPELEQARQEGKNWR